MGKQVGARAHLWEWKRSHNLKDLSLHLENCTLEREIMTDLMVGDLMERNR